MLGDWGEGREWGGRVVGGLEVVGRVGRVQAPSPPTPPCFALTHSHSRAPHSHSVMLQLARHNKTMFVFTRSHAVHSAHSSGVTRNVITFDHVTLFGQKLHGVKALFKVHLMACISRHHSANRGFVWVATFTAGGCSVASLSHRRVTAAVARVATQALATT